MMQNEDLLPNDVSQPLVHDGGTELLRDFAQPGRSGEQLLPVPQSVPPVPQPQPTPAPGPVHDGAVLRELTDSRIYLIVGGAKFLVPSSDELTALGYSESDVVVVEDGTLDTVPTAPRDGSLLQEREGATAFVMYHGIKYAIRDELALEPLRSPGNDLLTVPKAGLAEFREPKSLVLETDFPQPNYPISDPGWASRVAGGKQWLRHDPPRWEWIPVLHPDDELGRNIAGVSGTTVKPELSGSDNPFSHPFGDDWESKIAVDPGKGYEVFLAPSNDGNTPEGGTTGRRTMRP